jgi:hypothetical protein
VIDSHVLAVGELDLDLPVGSSRQPEIEVLHDGLWCGIAASGIGELSDRENERLGIDRARQDEFALSRPTAGQRRRPRAASSPRRSLLCRRRAASWARTRAYAPTRLPSASPH